MQTGENIAGYRILSPFGAGGMGEVWRADGREIVCSDFDGNLISVQVDGREETFDVGVAEPLFTVEAPEAGGSHFSMSADAQSFLVVPGVTQQADPLLNLVVNRPAQIDGRRDRS